MSLPSTNSAAFKANVKLCQAIEKEPSLYDPNHEHYRKRQPSEICWASVAAETGVSVDKCKRRWRQIRTDYGLNRVHFYLREKLAFLNAHLPSSDLSLADDQRDNESERDSKSKSKEPSIEPGYKDEEREEKATVEEQPLQTDTEPEPEPEHEKVQSKDQNKKETNKNKRKLSEDSQQADEKEEEAEQPQRLRLDSPQSEFFIKQSSKTAPNCLIIGKKPADITATTTTSTPRQLAADHFEAMADDSADETASVGGGRRLRRVAARKQLPIQKTASEQRITRLSRRKSMSVAAALSLRSSTSPVKMTPLPRTTLATAPSKLQPKAAKPSQPPTVAAAAAASAVVAVRDDIFPRPRASASPVASSAVVMARRPGGLQPSAPQQATAASQPQQQSATTTPLIRHFITPRPVPPVRPATGPTAAKRFNFEVPAAATPRAPPPHVHHEPLKLPAASTGATSSSPPQQQQQQQQQQQRLVSSSKTLVISTTSSNSNTQTNSIASSSSCNTNLASITAAPISSSALVKRGEKSTQTDNADVYSDDYFLDMVRPQLLEMNPRQKLHFKQKIFQALMETFDDATDFPGNGDVQHFNINTPSGYENVTDQELRLMRELVSIVSAAKHTPLTSTPSVVTALTIPSLGPRSAAKTAQSANALEKRMYRITPMGNNVKMVRQDSIDSNSSSSQRSNTATATATVAAAAASASQGKFSIPSSSSISKPPRIPDPLTSNKAAPVAGAIVMAKDPMSVRQMGRRYSIAGSPVNGASLEALLKRRQAHVPLSMASAQQRPRYSHSPNAKTGLGQGNSLLLRRPVVAGAQKQVAPPIGCVTLPQKPLQIGSMQGPHSSFNAFATPTAVRQSISPPKRGMVIANVKGQGQQQVKSSVAAVRAEARLSFKSLSSPNVANLLGDSRPQISNQPARASPAPTQSQAQPQPTPSQSRPHSQPAATATAAKGGAEESQMAGIIAADYFDMSRLKREPQDLMDDDILGM